MEFDKELILNYLNEFDSSGNYIWSFSVLISKIFKKKYAFTCYYTNNWINKYDNSIDSEKVKEMFIKDIVDVGNLLLEYNESFNIEGISILVKKLSNKKFMLSVFRELREMLYEESSHYIKNYIIVKQDKYISELLKDRNTTF